LPVEPAEPQIHMTTQPEPLPSPPESAQAHPSAPASDLQQRASAERASAERASAERASAERASEPALETRLKLITQNNHDVFKLLEEAIVHAARMRKQALHLLDTLAADCNALENGYLAEAMTMRARALSGKPSPAFSDVGQELAAAPTAEDQAPTPAPTPAAAPTHRWIAIDDGHPLWQDYRLYIRIATGEIDAQIQGFVGFLDGNARSEWEARLLLPDPYSLGSFARLDQAKTAVERAVNSGRPHRVMSPSGLWGGCAGPDYCEACRMVAGEKATGDGSAKLNVAGA